jgi:hypothetical protein
MKRNKLFSVLMVATALTLFSSFAFGQQTLGNTDLPGWGAAAFAATFQVDKIVVQVSTLEFIIDTEMSNPYPCERKATYYKDALVDLQEAKAHVDNAYRYCQALAKARDDINGKRILLLVFSEMSRATEAFNNALAHYYDAHFVVC